MGLRGAVLVIKAGNEPYVLIKHFYCMFDLIIVQQFMILLIQSGNGVSSCLHLNSKPWLAGCFIFLTYVLSQRGSKNKSMKSAKNLCGKSTRGIKMAFKVNRGAKFIRQ